MKESKRVIITRQSFKFVKEQQPKSLSADINFVTRPIEKQPWKYSRATFYLAA